MSSQHHLKESLRQLGYYAADNSEIPDIPISCLPLISSLVDDLSHSQIQISRLESDLDDCNNKSRDLNIQVSPLFRSKFDRNVVGKYRVDSDENR